MSYKEMPNTKTTSTETYKLNKDLADVKEGDFSWTKNKKIAGGTAKQLHLAKMERGNSGDQLSTLKKEIAVHEKEQSSVSGERSDQLERLMIEKEEKILAIERKQQREDIKNLVRKVEVLEKEMKRGEITTQRRDEIEILVAQYEAQIHKLEKSSSSSKNTQDHRGEEDHIKSKKKNAVVDKQDDLQNKNKEKINDLSERLIDAMSFNDVKRLIIEEGKIVGADGHEYKADDLLVIIEKVRSGELDTDYITRTSGLRAKVMELMTEEKNQMNHSADNSEGSQKDNTDESPLGNDQENNSEDADLHDASAETVTESGQGLVERIDGDSITDETIVRTMHSSRENESLQMLSDKLTTAREAYIAKDLAMDKNSSLFKKILGVGNRSSLGVFAEEFKEAKTNYKDDLKNYYDAIIEEELGGNVDADERRIIANSLNVGELASIGVLRNQEKLENMTGFERLRNGYVNMVERYNRLPLRQKIYIGGAFIGVGVAAGGAGAAVAAGVGGAMTLRRAFGFSAATVGFKSLFEGMADSRRMRTATNEATGFAGQLETDQEQDENERAQQIENFLDDHIASLDEKFQDKKDWQKRRWWMAAGASAGTLTAGSWVAEKVSGWFGGSGTAIEEAVKKDPDQAVSPNGDLPSAQTAPIESMPIDRPDAYADKPNEAVNSELNKEQLTDVKPASQIEDQPQTQSSVETTTGEKTIYDYVKDIPADKQMSSAELSERLREIRADAIRVEDRADFLNQLNKNDTLSIPIDKEVSSQEFDQKLKEIIDHREFTQDEITRIQGAVTELSEGSSAEPTAEPTAEPSDLKESVSASAETTGDAALAYEVKKGDTLWKILENAFDNAATNDPELAGLNEGQKTYFIDAMKDKFAAMPSEDLQKIGFSSGDVNELAIGDTLELEDSISRFDPTYVENKFAEALNLSDTAIDQIESNNEKIADYAAEHPDVMLTEEKIDEILRMNTVTGGVDVASVDAGSTALGAGEIAVIKDGGSVGRTLSDFLKERGMSGAEAGKESHSMLTEFAEKVGIDVEKLSLVHPGDTVDIVPDPTSSGEFMLRGVTIEGGESYVLPGSTIDTSMASGATVSPSEVGPDISSKDAVRSLTDIMADTDKGLIEKNAQLGQALSEAEQQLSDYAAKMEELQKLIDSGDPSSPETINAQAALSQAREAYDLYQQPVADAQKMFNENATEITANDLEGANQPTEAVKQEGGSPTDGAQVDEGSNASQESAATTGETSDTISANNEDPAVDSTSEMEKNLSSEELSKISDMMMESQDVQSDFRETSGEVSAIIRDIERVDQKYLDGGYSKEDTDLDYAVEKEGYIEAYNKAYAQLQEIHKTGTDLQEQLGQRNLYKPYDIDLKNLDAYEVTNPLEDMPEEVQNAYRMINDPSSSDGVIDVANDTIEQWKVGSDRATVNTTPPETLEKTIVENDALRGTGLDGIEEALKDVREATESADNSLDQMATGEDVVSSGADNDVLEQESDTSDSEAAQGNEVPQSPEELNALYDHLSVEDRSMVDDAIIDTEKILFGENTDIVDQPVLTVAGPNSGAELPKDVHAKFLTYYTTAYSDFGRKIIPSQNETIEVFMKKIETMRFLSE